MNSVKSIVRLTVFDDSFIKKLSGLIVGLTSKGSGGLILSYQF